MALPCGTAIPSGHSAMTRPARRELRHKTLRLDIKNGGWTLIFAG